MIPQFAVPPSAPGRAEQMAGATLNGSDSSLEPLTFGDLLAAMAVPMSDSTSEQGSAPSADVLTLVDVDDSGNAAMAMGTAEVAQATPASKLLVLLAEAGLPDVKVVTAGEAEAVVDSPAWMNVSIEPRQQMTSLATPSILTAGAAAPVDVPEILQSFSSAAGQSVVTETVGGNMPTNVLQAPPSERLEAALAKSTVALPLPPQEARAAIAQTLDQVVWMTREGVHQARLQLEPAHLGRVDIWLDLDGGEAKLHLGAHHAPVREALEAVLPRLRDALAQHGMSLTDASVSDSGREQPEYSDGQKPAALAAAAGDDSFSADGVESLADIFRPAGLLDLYA